MKWNVRNGNDALTSYAAGGGGEDSPVQGHIDSLRCSRIEQAIAGLCKQSAGIAHVQIFALCGHLPPQLRLWFKG